MNGYEKRRKRIFDIIQIGQREDLPSRIFDIFIVIVIILNILVMFMDTFDRFEKYSSILGILEVITMLIFAVEYVLRIWTAEYLYPGCSKFHAVLKFLFSFDGIIHLLTILPFFFLTGFVVFRMLRVVRIFHLFRINAHYDSFNVITSVLYEKRNQIISSVFIILVLMLSSSLCMYSAEHDVQPEAFNNAFSGIWWSISTILTVGYGDIYPVTVMGRIMAIVIAFLGVGAVAIPTGIISAGFVEQYTQMQASHPDGRAKGISGIKVEDDSIFENRMKSEIERQMNVEILVVVREGNAIVPSGDIMMKRGDTIVYQTNSII